MNKYILNELKIEVTYKCPLACVHCSSNAYEGSRLEITKEKCLQIIDEAAIMGVTELAFSGGEPLVWDGIIDVVQHAGNYGMQTSVYTSGNCPNAREIFYSLSQAKLRKAIFSLYSDKELEHNRVTRIASSFANTISSIGIALEQSIIPEIHFVALASNFERLESLVRFSRTVGVNKVSVLRFVPQGRGRLIQDKDTLTKEQNIKLAKTIRKLRDEGYDIRTGSPFNVLLLNERPKCMAAQDRLIIAPDLFIYPCDAFKQIAAERIAGKVECSNLSSSSLPECWENSSYLQAIRVAILTNKEEPCCSCKMYSRCLSGCLAQKFLHHSNLYKNPDPACLMG